MIELIIYSAATLIMLFGFGRFMSRSHQKLVETMQMYERLNITPEDSVLPEAHIMKFKPVPLPMYGKVIYIQPLSNDGHKVYSKMYFDLLTKYQQQLGGLRFLLLNDLLTEEGINKLKTEWTDVRYNQSLIEDINKLINKVVLANPSMNPSKITLADTGRLWNWMDTLQVFQMIYAVQVQASQDFTLYLLGRLTGAGTQKDGSPFQRRQESRSQKSASGPLMPLYSRRNEQQKEVKDSMTSSSNEVNPNG